MLGAALALAVAAVAVIGILGTRAAQASAPAGRTRLLGSLYTDLLPAVDARLFKLAQLHADDPPAEHADNVRFGRQWSAGPRRSA